jgi:hypothetical protein
MTREEVLSSMERELPISNWLAQKIVEWLIRKGIIK